MRWNFSGGRDLLRSIGDRFRREHSVWLTHAVKNSKPYPRIPTRRVDDGGYSKMMRLEHGPKRAAKWWSLAGDRVESLDRR